MFPTENKNLSSRADHPKHPTLKTQTSTGPQPVTPDSCTTHTSMCSLSVITSLRKTTKTHKVEAKVSIQHPTFQIKTAVQLIRQLERDWLQNRSSLNTEHAKFILQQQESSWKIDGRRKRIQCCRQKKR